MCNLPSPKPHAYLQSLSCGICVQNILQVFHRQIFLPVTVLYDTNAARQKMLYVTGKECTSCYSGLRLNTCIYVG